jgi:hypothetical protein
LILSTITCHEQRVYPLSFCPYPFYRGRLFAFLPLSSFDHSSLFNSPVTGTGDAGLKIEPNPGDIDEPLAIV